MKFLPIAGKYMFAIPMLGFAMGHFTKADAMTGMVPSFMPAAIFWVYLVGVGLLAASVAIIIGKKAKLATQLLGLMLLLFVLLIHLPGMMGGNEGSMPMLLKDLALAGSAWYMSGHMSD